MALFEDWNAGEQLFGDDLASEERAHREILDLLAAIAAIEGKYDRLSPRQARPKSILYVDDALTSPFQTSHAVKYALLAATDNLRAVRLLTSPDGQNLRLSIVASFPLIRSVLESSGMVVWLLTPDVRRERIERLLRMRTDEWARDQTMKKEMLRLWPTDTHAERSALEGEIRRNARSARDQRRLVRRIGEKAGADPSLVARGLPAWRDIFADGFGGQPRGRVVGPMWYFLSGLSHPSASRGLQATSFHKVSESAGVISGAMTGRASTLVYALTTAIWTHNRATDLLRDRLLRPDGESLSYGL